MVAAGSGAAAVGAQGLQAQGGQLAAFFLRVVSLGVAIGTACPRLGIVAARTTRTTRTAGLARMPLVHLAIGLGGWARFTSGDREVGSGAGVVVVACAVAPAGELVGGHEAVDVLGVGLPVGRVVVDLLVGGTVVLFIGPQVVDEHQAVLAFGVLEEVADAPFLAQAAEEVEVALVELRAEVPRGIGLDQALVHGERVVGQKCIQDLHDSLVLEDPAVGGPGGQVQPGAQGQLVLEVAAFFSPEGRVGDEGVDLAGAGAQVVAAGAGGAGDELAGAVELEGAGDFATDEAIEVEVGRASGFYVQAVGGLEEELIFEEAVEAFVTPEADRLQCGVAEHDRNGLAADLERARADSAEYGHETSP